MVLLLSSITLPQDKQNDRDDFESAAHLLRELEKKGNFAAKEYLGHLDLLVSSTATFEANTIQSQPEAQSAMLMTNDFQGTAAAKPYLQSTDAFGDANALEPITTEMAIFGAPIQDFLMEGDIPLFDDDTLASFDWLNENIMTPISLE